MSGSYRVAAVNGCVHKELGNPPRRTATADLP